MKINNLPVLRYSITGPSNERYQLAYGQGRLAPRMTTYSQLIEKHTAALRRDTRPSSQKQVIRNHGTALRAFLKSSYKSEQSIVGPELAADFTQKLNAHLATCSLGERSKADRKSLLRAWKSTYDSLTSASSPAPTKRERHSADPNGALENPFEAELKRALREAGLSAKSAARLAGVSTSAVGRWNRGALPNIRSAKTIGKLEVVLDLAPNTLVDCLDGCLAANALSQPNVFRTRLKSMGSLKFHLKATELSPEFVQEWRTFLNYKTAIRPPNGLERRKGGAWTLSQAEHSATDPTVLNSVAGAISHTADMNWERMSAFLGFLRLPEQQGGLGQELLAAQTLAWLCVPEAIDAYLTFSSQRSAGLKHEGHRTFCNLVASVTREQHGYLRQSPHLSRRLPHAVLLGRTWKKLCDDAFATAEAWSEAATDTSRDPQEAITFFLSQEKPLRPIFDAMHRIRRLADGCTPGSLSEAVLRRDELLLGFFTSNPLRAKNVKTLTWRPDNSGHVYKSSAGQWRLRIEAREFKTRRTGKQKKGKLYDVAIAKWLTPLLENYLERFRLVLCGDAIDTGFLFLTSGRGGRMNDMNRRVFELTKRFIPKSGGISPHAFRHLVATVWLSEHPNDFFVVAELLNDSLQVVLSTYVHLKKDISFSKYEAYVSAMV
jgi:integrase/transcriptional regulator with XRE-family HTH domain